MQTEEQRTNANWSVINCLADMTGIMGRVKCKTAAVGSLEWFVLAEAWLFASRFVSLFHCLSYCRSAQAERIVDRFVVQQSDQHAV